jgi:catalase
MQQMMTPKDAEEKWPHIALDPTKVWPHKCFPLHEFAKLVLDRNPENFFDEIEQVGDLVG